MGPSKKRFCLDLTSHMYVIVIYFFLECEPIFFLFFSNNCNCLTQFFSNWIQNFTKKYLFQRIIDIEIFLCTCWPQNPNLKIYSITAIMKVETVIFTSITEESMIGRAIILVIIYVKTFTTDVIVFTGYVMICLMSH